ncbi:MULTISPECIES: DUF5667 domain-containing protein [Streptomyces]|uniref:DUF5667 domain-containing protein n=1 Tax=Streptomyces olivaceus TaxID=47716 RepID=A0ABS7VX31_STROV|nr:MULTISPECIES: DUF5667 domain-containing protein [Streptomyces]MBZ6086717.1 hypothetical protein [Streptomyces olivaceus]MBZ6094682.1 hypothetical protein [Streptomyces olivaceus]MBZ6108043.1 hypothetical protein [Streptomyces olivaceus]MBZ6115798.1 hypothetical protein [Streptomyces olivaceus]MBZ6121927.1 hypothetical protein [Streptomyces olivaceus]
MIANVSAHRRANAFAQAVEEQSEPGPAAEQSEGPATAGATADPTEQGQLVTLAHGLETLPRPELDPEVKVVQRARLVAAFEAMMQEGTAGGGAADTAVPEQRRARGAHRAAPLSRFRPRSRLAKGLTAGGLSVSVAAGAFGGVAAASSDALPGDSLYGLKRGMEDFRLGLADGNDERGRAYLDLASTRLNEARRLMERGRSGSLDHESLGEVRRALSGMRHDASEGHRLLSALYARDPDSLAPMQALSAFSESHRESWGALRDRLPVQLGDVSEQVSSVFDAIDDDVAPLQSMLPQPPAEDEESGDGGSPGGSGPATGDTPGSGHSSAPSTGDDGTSDRGRSDSRGPSESADSGQENDGLLGGGTGGLFDPPKDDTTPSSPSTGDNTPPVKPDVTLPPLLPGLLPGLGIEAEDAD